MSLSSQTHSLELIALIKFSDSCDSSLDEGFIPCLFGEQESNLLKNEFRSCNNWYSFSLYEKNISP